MFGVFFLIEILLWADLFKVNYKKNFKIFRNILNKHGSNLTYCDSGNTIHFSIFTMLIFPPSQKITIPKYNAVSYSETEKLFFSAAVKNNFNMPGGDKLRTCVCYVFEIINFTNCRTWLFANNKYIQEQNFSVSWVLKQS